MTAADLKQLNFDELVDHWVTWLRRTLHEDFRRLFVPMLRELAATGRPVEPQRIADLSGMPLARTLAVLRVNGDTEWDPSGERVAGLGLTGIRTRHRYQVHGHHLWTWCAVDSLLFVPLIGAPARIQSPCLATGDPILLDVTPTGVERVEPATAVVSFLTPAINSREAACDQNNFYRSADVAADWLAKHPQGRPLPVAEAFEVLRRAGIEVYGEEAW